MAYQPKSYRKFLAGTVTAAVVASAVAPAASAAEADFQDIKNLDAEAQSAINSLAAAGVIKGYENGTKFDPFQNVKRGQVALMLSRVEQLGLDASADTETDFSDVSDAELVGPIEALVNAGIATGYQDGTFKPFSEIQRQHMAKFIVEAFDLELNEDADVNVTDLDKATEEMRPYIEILASHGITTQSEFKPNASVSRYAFSLFLQRAIDATTPAVELPAITIASEDSTHLLVTIEGDYAELTAEDFVFDGDLKVLEAEVVTEAAAEEEVTTTTYRLTTSEQEAGKTYNLVEFMGVEVEAGTVDPIVVPEAPATPEVESVSAINAIEVAVKFNQPVDRITAEDESNYRLVGSLQGNVTVNAVTQIDDSTYLLIVNPLRNGEDFTVEASKDIKLADGSAIPAKIEAKGTFTDTTVPTVTSVRTLSTNHIEVTFSEPVLATGGLIEDAFTLHEIAADGTEGVDIGFKVSPQRAQNGRVVVLEPNNQIKAGTKYNFYTNADSSASVKVIDYAGYNSPATKNELQYVADTTVPQATSVKLLDQEYALVTFNKPVATFSASNIYWNTDGQAISNSNTANLGSVQRVDAQTFKVKFNIIPTGVKYFFVSGATDYAGNAAPAAKFEVEVPNLKEPKVESISALNATQVRVKLNTDLQDATTVFTDSASVTDKTKGRSYYTVKNAKGEDIVIKSVSYGVKEDGVTPDHSVRVITLYSDLTEGKNSVTVQNLKDSLNRVFPTVTENVTLASVPTLKFALIGKSSTADVAKEQILVNFEETTSAVPANITPANVIVTTATGTKVLSEVAGGSIVKTSDDTYMISTDKNAMNALGTVQFTGLVTADGKTIAPASKTPDAPNTADLSATAGTNAYVASTTVSGTTVTIKVNGLLSSLNASDFRLYEDGVNKTADLVQNISYVNSTTKDKATSTITITLKEELAPGKTYGLQTAPTVTATKDIFGNKIVDNVGLALADTTPAALVRSYVSESDAAADKITLDLTKAPVGNLTKEDFKVTTSTGTPVAVSNVAVNGTQVVLTTADFDANKEVNVEFKKSSSTANVADFATTTDSFRITEVAFGSGDEATSLEGDETITLTFNKYIDPAVVEAANVASNTSATADEYVTAFGTLAASSGDVFTGAPAGQTATYELVANNKVKITLTGLSSATDLHADILSAAETLQFVIDNDAEVNNALGTLAIQTVDGQPLIANTSGLVITNLPATSLQAVKTVTLAPAADLLSAVVTANYTGGSNSVYINATNVTTGTNASLTFDTSATITPTLTGNTVTVAATGTVTTAQTAGTVVGYIFVTDAAATSQTLKVVLNKDLAAGDDISATDLQIKY